MLMATVSAKFASALVPRPKRNNHMNQHEGT